MRRTTEWGNVTAYTSSSGNWPIPFGFAGGLYDEDTRLVRFGARDYDPRIGRWTSKDPIRWEGGQANFYVYVGNAPLMFSDPEGKVAPLVIAGICAAGGCEALIGAFIVTTAYATGLLDNPFPVIARALSDGMSLAKDSRTTNPLKADSPIWQGAQPYRSGLRRSGDEIWDWDALHNDIEVYDKRGSHLGTRDPTTGEMCKPKVKGRKLDL